MNSNRTRLAREHLKLSVTKPKSPFEKPIIDQVMAKKWNTIDFKDSVLVSLTRYFMKRGMIKPLKSNKKSKKSRRSKTSYRVRRNKVGRFHKKQSQSLNLFYQKKNRELKQLQSQNKILNKTEGIEEHEEYPYLELREADIDVEESTIVQDRKSDFNLHSPEKTYKLKSHKSSQKSINQIEVWPSRKRYAPMNKEVFNPPAYVEELNQNRIEKYIKAEIKKKQVDYSSPKDPRLHLEDLSAPKQSLLSQEQHVSNIKKVEKDRLPPAVKRELLHAEKSFLQNKASSNGNKMPLDQESNQYAQHTLVKKKYKELHLENKSILECMKENYVGSIRVSVNYNLMNFNL